MIRMGIKSSSLPKGAMKVKGKFKNDVLTFPNYYIKDGEIKLKHKGSNAQIKKFTICGIIHYELDHAAYPYGVVLTLDNIVRHSICDEVTQDEKNSNYIQRELRSIDVMTPEIMDYLGTVIRDSLNKGEYKTYKELCVILHKQFPNVTFKIPTLATRLNGDDAQERWAPYFDIAKWKDLFYASQKHIITPDIVGFIRESVLERMNNRYYQDANWLFLQDLVKVKFKVELTGHQIRAITSLNSHKKVHVLYTKDDYKEFQTNKKEYHKQLRVG